LDYDGTLAPFVALPELARPSKRVLEILHGLAQDPKNTLVIISGRERETLDGWLGHLNLAFVAEHGAFEKTKEKWKILSSDDTDWKDTIRPELESALSQEDMFVEEKETSLVLHYRKAEDQEKALRTATTLERQLWADFAANLNLRVDHAHKVVEVRPKNWSKGNTVRDWSERKDYDFILCAGDSLTDEDMFKALSTKAGAYCVKVGSGETAAGRRVSNTERFIDFLESLKTVY
jgi:trehalose 6-phosphate synthase/phosphatase